MAVDEREDRHDRVVDRRRLGRRAAREARQQRALALDARLDRVGLVAGDGERALGDLRQARHAGRTVTSRKRAGAAPWLTAIACPGSPLPQFVRPQSCHSERSQTASSPPQKRGVIPL